MKALPWLVVLGIVGVLVLLLVGGHDVVREQPPEGMRVWVADDDTCGVGRTVCVRVAADDVAALEARKTSANPWGLFLGGRFLRDVPPIVDGLSEKGRTWQEEDAALARTEEEAKAAWAAARGAEEVRAKKAYDDARSARATHAQTDAALRTVRFRLDRSERNRATWAALFGGRFFSGRTVAAEVGLSDGSRMAKGLGEGAGPSASPNNTVRIGAVTALRGGTALLVVALFVVLAWVATSRYRLLHDHDSEGKLPTYSLARSQILWWTFHVVGAYLLIWAATRDSNTVNETALVLMGVSGGTWLLSRAIDLQPKPAGTTTVKAQSRGFLVDILSDIHEKTGERSIAVHRLQTVVWNLALTVIFWASVRNELAMPEFSGALLGLLGISAGTYLGVKVTEGR